MNKLPRVSVKCLLYQTPAKEINQSEITSGVLLSSVNLLLTQQ